MRKLIVAIVTLLASSCSGGVGEYLYYDGEGKVHTSPKCRDGKDFAIVPASEVYAYDGREPQYYCGRCITPKVMHQIEDSCRVYHRKRE